MELLTKFYQLICCIQKPVYPDPYNFQFSVKQPASRNRIQFESNFVKTSKYTWYDFPIKALLLQFKRIANIYFLIISILLTIPIISPLSPASSWAPLGFVLLISILRQGYQDYQRHVSDSQMNFQLKTMVWRDGKFEELEWSQVLTGDLVKVQGEDLFPCDLILLASTNQGGITFIQTASLDGEKNLKPRNAYDVTNQYIQENKLMQLSGSWIGTLPDKQLHKFSSKMHLSIQKQPILFEGDKQLLYRGARLKNTKHIIGLAIYTGKNTKIMLNSQSSSIKMSQIQAKVNVILGIILLIQLILSIMVAVLHGFFRAQHINQFYYVDWSAYSTSIDSVLMFFVYFVLINTMIPISLIVSIQIVKMCQSFFISKDNLMYSAFRKKFVSVKTASLNEELGQIQYVFTDKTGTLTMNLMEFKIACIGQQMFGDLALIQKNSLVLPQTQKGFHDDNLKKLIESGQGNKNLNRPIIVTNKQGGNSITFSSLKELTQQYLQVLSMAHECVSDYDKKGVKIYQGPSPDQIALVDAAKSMGYQFIKSTKQSTTINIKGIDKTLQLLEIFSFTSDRKRMSAIVRDKNGLIKMYTKGADNIIKQRLAGKSALNLDSQLIEFSKIGLRTLLIAMRTISDAEYQAFRTNISNLPAENREHKFNQCVAELEQNLFLIGATAVLDRLQDQVPETIRDLIRANIKVWMLTGDKMQTAQNIAKSCKLIQDNFEILRYEGQGQESSMISYLKQLVVKVKKLTQQDIPKALLIQGHDLTPILNSQSAKDELAELSKYCQAVVCCRLLPLQKAQVVAVVRQKLNKITLAIGDGSNDVPMIKTAHIGIGLFGEEGMGAVQASDYALPQFRMLWRLLLVHGRWNYIRISQMILYFFYKNMVFTIPQYVFAFYCGYSGQTLFDDFYITLYNLIFTSIPLVVRAILQQDINYIVKKVDVLNVNVGQRSSSQLMQPRAKPLQILAQQKYLPSDVQINKYLYRLFPKVYFIGQQNAIFNYTNYFLWLMEGVVEAIMIFMICMYSINSGSINQDGVASDMWIIGLTVFSAVIVVVTFKLSTHTKFWSVFLFIAVSILSLTLYLCYMWISNYALSVYVQGTTFIAWTSVKTYLIVVLSLCFVLTIDGIVLSIDFNRGGYISKMRQVIQKEAYDNQREYTDTLKLSENLTTRTATVKEVQVKMDL